jgi:hypothetical protein
MSRREGIGYEWYQKYGWEDCHKNDFVVINGKEVRPPRYYDKLLDDDKLEVIKKQRIEDMEEPIIEYDQRMDRLWVSEEVKIKKLERLIRNV